MSDDLMYPYRHSRAIAAKRLILFGFAAACFAYKAQTNARGLIIDGVIYLRPDEASVTYGVFAALSLAFTMLAIGLFWRAHSGRPPILAIGTTEVRVPVGPAQREIAIPYRDIYSIQHRRVRSEEFLTIQRRSGKSAHIAASLLPSNDVFALVRTELTARSRLAQRL